MKLARDRERLARLEPGGSAERPIEIGSASLVEVHGRSAECLRCGAGSRVDDHTAEGTGAASVRVAHLVCPQCGAERRLYFRIVAPLAN